MKPHPFIVSAAIIALGVPAATANHIDFIVDGGFMISGMDGEVVTASQTGAGGNIIGAERDVTLTTDLGQLRVTLDAPAGAGPVGPNPGSLISVIAESADALGTLDLLYNGPGAAGLGGLDFGTAWNFFGINLPTLSGGDLDLRVTVADTAGNRGEAARPGLNRGGTYYFAFTDPAFTNAGVDFTSLNSVGFSFEAVDLGVSYTIGAITREVVPEPGVVALVLFGAVGLLTRRRRASL